MIISVVQNKGGVGKTSLVTNLAALLSKKHKVLIIDMDPQSNCAQSFGQNPDKIKYSMFDVLVHNKPIKNIIISLSKNLYLAPTNGEMNSLEFNILCNKESYPRPFKLLARAIAPITGAYDYIIIDTPPSLGLSTGNALAASDDILIPYLPEPYGNLGLINVIQTINAYRDDLNPHLNIKGVVGMFVDTRLNVHSDMLQKARATCTDSNINFYLTTIPRSIQPATVTAYDSKPVVISHRGGRVRAAYEVLLEEMNYE